MPEPTFSHLIAILCGLFTFGVLYNLLINELERRGVEGWTWLQVVIGVAITVLAMGFVTGWLNVMYLLAGFSAAGTPMAIGAIYRYEQKKAAYRRTVQQHERQAQADRK